MRAAVDAPAGEGFEKLFVLMVQGFAVEQVQKQVSVRREARKVEFAVVCLFEDILRKL